MITLKDLKDIDFNLSLDFMDDEVATSFDCDLEEIDDSIASEIIVTGISNEYITCKFTNYLRRFAIFHPTNIKRYLNDHYFNGETKDYLINQLTKHPLGSNKGDIMDDGGDAVRHFIGNDMYNFITSNKEV